MIVFPSYNSKFVVNLIYFNFNKGSKVDSKSSNKSSILIAFILKNNSF